MAQTEPNKASSTEIPFDLPWWTKAYMWFRRWGWIPLGIVLIILGFALGGFILNRREDGRVVGPVSDLRQKIQDNNKALDSEVEALRRAHEAEVIRIEREHEQALQNLSEDQERRRQELRKDPKKLARWLTGLARSDSAANLS
jgi:hypothetical protein